MTYAVAQKNLEPPTTEQLKNAFRGVPGLTPTDAFTMGRAAFGILAGGFDRQRAGVLQTALTAQGVETEVIEEGHLPTLPQMRSVHQFECTKDALMIHDSLNRSFPLKWENVMLIAAGKVNVNEFNEVRTVTPQSRFGPLNQGPISIPSTVPGINLPGPWPDAPAPEVRYETKEQRLDHWLLEIFVTGATLRYSVNADKAGPMLFGYLGSRRTSDLAANFKLLVQDLVNGAPRAAINRGTYYLRENSSDPFYYPTLHAYHQELVWLLWQMSPGQPGKAA